MENIKALLRHELMGSIYNKLSTGTTLLMISGGVASVASIITMQNPTIINSCGALVAASSIGYFVVDALKKNEIKGIRNLYQEFIRNYNELNRTFGLQNPAELQAMFVWLLYEGYLSNEKKFQASAEQTREIFTIEGAEIINGSGVCRHAMPMFTDILNDYGIKAFNLSVYKEKLDIRISKKFERANIFLESMTELTKESTTNEQVLKIVENMINEKRAELENAKLEEMLSAKKNQITKGTKGIDSNHVIGLAIYNGESYYLGPNWHEIYELDSDSKLLYTDIGTAQIISERKRLHEKSQNLQMLKDFLDAPYPCSSREEALKSMRKTEKICEQNRGIFEQFYRENEELYKEVSMRLRKL